MPNSGRCVIAYLCAELHVVDGGEDHRTHLAILIQAAPNAEFANQFGLVYAGSCASRSSEYA